MDGIRVGLTDKSQGNLRALHCAGRNVSSEISQCRTKPRSRKPPDRLGTLLVFSVPLSFFIRVKNDIYIHPSRYSNAPHQAERPLGTKEVEAGASCLDRCRNNGGWDAGLFCRSLLCSQSHLCDSRLPFLVSFLSFSDYLGVHMRSLPSAVCAAFHSSCSAAETLFLNPLICCQLSHLPRSRSVLVGSSLLLSHISFHHSGLRIK